MRRTIHALAIGFLLLTGQLIVGAAPETSVDALLAPMGLHIDYSHGRDLAAWLPDIEKYSARHYGEPTWRLAPKALVLHYTAGKHFPDELVTSKDVDGERPGLSVHYVVDGQRIWQILPPNVRTRGAYGFNHRGINIEMVASDGEDLFQNRQSTLQTTVALARVLMRRYDIPLTRVYGHSDVATMDPFHVPEVLDLIDAKPYDRTDPGEQNLNWIRRHLQNVP